MFLVAINLLLITGLNWLNEGAYISFIYSGSITVNMDTPQACATVKKIHPRYISYHPSCINNNYYVHVGSSWYDY